MHQNVRMYLGYLSLIIILQSLYYNNVKHRILCDASSFFLNTVNTGKARSLVPTRYISSFLWHPIEQV